MKVARLPYRLLLGWGFGSLGTATLLNALGTVQLFFFVNMLGISGTVAGSIIFVSKIYDLLADAPMGIVSDRSRSSWGRRVPWMAAGGVVCGLSFWLVFNPPAVAEANMVIWQLAFLLLCATGYTLFNIPYIALAGEISDSPTQRARLMSFRVAFLQAGIVLGAAAALVLVSVGGGGRAGYGFMASIVCWVIAVPMLVAAWTCREADRGAMRAMQGSARVPVLSQLRGVLDNKPFMLLLAIKVPQMIATAVFGASILFLMKSVLGRTEAEVGTKFGLAATAGTMLFIPVWFRVMNRIGKARAWAIATLLIIAALLSFLLADKGESDWLFIGRAFVFGICTAGMLLVAQTLLTDTMQFDRESSGQKREGILAGFYSSVEQVAFAFGPLLVGVLLDIGGYDKSAAVQSADAQRAIYFCVAILPVICYLLSLPVIRAYRFELAERGNHGG